jgi:hypothetical protein
LIHTKFVVEIEHGSLPPVALGVRPASYSAAENCARIKDLGFTTTKHIKMYGEDFELVSDPFVEGDYTTVHVIGRNDPTIRALRLPVSILVGLRSRFRRVA